MDDSLSNLDTMAVGGIFDTHSFDKSSSNSSELISNTVNDDNQKVVSNYTKIKLDDLDSNVVQANNQQEFSTMMDTSINNDFKTSSPHSSSMNTSALSNVSNMDDNIKTSLFNSSSINKSTLNNVSNMNLDSINNDSVNFSFNVDNR